MNIHIECKNKPLSVEEPTFRKSFQFVADYSNENLYAIDGESYKKLYKKYRNIIPEWEK